jgi:glycosyltransferase involved in cell wall biosynthesis
MSALVTWLLPVKNGMPYLTETLASIEAQTFRHFTVLAWNDASTDSSLAELQRWIPARLPGRIISKVGGGLGMMLASMVEQSKTEICARIDADDVNLSNRLDKQLQILERDQSLGALGSQVIKIDKHGVECGQHHNLPLEFDDILHRMLHAWVIWHPSVIFRRSAVLEAGNYNNYPETLIEDYDLWMRLARVSRLQNMPECLVKYRVMESTSTEKAIKEGRLIPAMNHCFAVNAPETFGIKSKVAWNLRQRNQPDAILALIPALRHLSKNHGGSILQRLKSQSFRDSMVSLRSWDDNLTLNVDKFLEPGIPNKLQAIKSILGIIKNKSLSRF